MPKAQIQGNPQRYFGLFCNAVEMEHNVSKENHLAEPSFFPLTTQAYDSFLRLMHP